MTRGRTAVTFCVLALLLGGAKVFRYKLDGPPRSPTQARREVGRSRLPGSVYDLGLRVRDSDGIVRVLGDLRGHPVLASMFFASCTSACPLVIDEMKRVAAATPPGVREDLRLLLVSFDPERDTPAVLVDVARRHDLDMPRWRISVAPDEATARAVAAVFGIRYRAAAGGMFDHTTAVTVLDRRGEVRGRAENPAAVSTVLATVAEQDRLQ